MSYCQCGGALGTGGGCNNCGGNGAGDQTQQYSGRDYSANARQLLTDTKRGWYHGDLRDAKKAAVESRMRNQAALDPFKRMKP